jgi:succinate dehydrogenase / fumarate reductase flavoprotein subunit
LAHSIYSPETKQLSQRAVNFSPKIMDTMEPMIRKY